MGMTNTLTIVLAAGLVGSAAASDRQQKTPFPTERMLSLTPVEGGHFYINAATGERILNFKETAKIGQRGSTEVELWAQDNTTPCTDLGAPYTEGGAGLTLFEDPFAEIASAPITDEVWMDWGDVPANTKVDGFSFIFSSLIDTDGEDIPGMNAVYTFYDQENGFNWCDRVTLLSLTVQDMAGNAADPGFLTVWTYTIDLNGLATMEFGDDDGDSQGADLFNEFSYFDADFDGLHDIGWAVEHQQPEDPAFQGVTAQFPHAPRGTVDPVTGELVIDTSFPGGTPGAEDAWDVFLGPGSFNEGTGEYEPGAYEGTFGFIHPDGMGGFITFGFTCDGDGDGIFEGDDEFTPWGGFYMILLALEGGEPVCPGDFDGSGAIDIFDLLGFIDAYNSGTPAADFDGSGAVDIFDLLGYIDAYTAGCP